MINARDIIREFLADNELEVIKGANGRFAQNYGYDGDMLAVSYGLYDEAGDFFEETFDIEQALNYIGLEDKNG